MSNLERLAALIEQTCQVESKQKETTITLHYGDEEGLTMEKPHQIRVNSLVNRAQPLIPHKFDPRYTHMIRLDSSDNHQLIQKNGNRHMG
jgi:hypothetical protein